MPESDEGGHQKDAHRQGAGKPQGMQKGVQKEGVLSVDGVFHGIVDSASGHQGEDTHQEVPGHWATADPGHDLRVGGNDNGGQEGTGDVVAQRLGEQIDQPTQSTGKAADQDARAVDVIDNGKGAAGHKSKEHRQQVLSQKLHLQHPPAKQSGKPQGKSGAQGDGYTDQEGVGDLGNTGHHISRHHVPNGIGEHDAGH